MIGRVYALVIDCPDPAALADFYAELTGYDVIHAEEDWVTLGKGDDPRIAFQLAPDHQPPQWPDPDRPQQMHLDIFVPDVAEAEPKVLAMGAKLLDGADRSGFRVYADPAGHPFCLCREDPTAP
jgi:catechol 2,3-dioxygenase-like lactoylglutathione lyase family enzyme